MLGDLQYNEDKHAWVLGHFADRTFCLQTFRQQDISPTDISSKVCNGHFADRHFTNADKIMLISIKYFLDADELKKQ